MFCCLTGVGGNADLCALGALLAGDTAGLALGGSSLLGLVGLLDLLGLSLLVLDVLQVGGALGSTGLGAHRAALLDDVQGSTNDGTLGLDGTASALLGDLLRDTLAVLATEQDSPGDAAGVLALQEQGLGLAVLETEDLAVATDEQLTLKDELV